MKKLILLAMLVLGTGFAVAQTSKTMDMSMDMEMPMDTPDMGMLAKQAMASFTAYMDANDAAVMVCKTMCTEKDMMISDLKMFKKHAEMVLSNKQMKKIMNMMMMEMDMKMDMDK